MSPTETLSLSKQTSHAFGREVYLLGRYKTGQAFWMEEPRWDCGWYWGFGYIETYTGTSPARSRGICSHSHYDSQFTGKKESYDFDKKAWVCSTDYRHIISDNPDVAECVLTKEEQWLLSEYMATAYTLKKAAELFGRGTSHLTTPPTPLVKDAELAKRINEVELPKVFQAIKQLLT